MPLRLIRHFLISAVDFYDRVYVAEFLLFPSSFSIPMRKSHQMANGPVSLFSKRERNTW
jgi:hypothetical protein